MIAKSNILGWKWRVTKGREFTLPFYYSQLSPLTIDSDSGNALVTLAGDKLYIARHYHFDGATCAPDFEKVLPATAVHDAMLQLHTKYPQHVREMDAHEAFRVQMDRDEFQLGWLYHWGVTGWRRKFYKYLTKDDDEK